MYNIVRDLKRNHVVPHSIDKSNDSTVSFTNNLCTSSWLRAGFKQLIVNRSHNPRPGGGIFRVALASMCSLTITNAARSPIFFARLDDDIYMQFVSIQFRKSEVSSL